MKWSPGCGCCGTVHTPCESHGSLNASWTGDSCAAFYDGTGPLTTLGSCLYTTGPGKTSPDFACSVTIGSDTYYRAGYKIEITVRDSWNRPAMSATVTYWFYLSGVGTHHGNFVTYDKDTWDAGAFTEISSTINVAGAGKSTSLTLN